MDKDLIKEFAADWRLSGRASRTADIYAKYLEDFVESRHSMMLTGAKTWLAETRSDSVRRKRAQALRAFGRWTAENAVAGLDWLHRVPVPTERLSPQETATNEDFQRAIKTLEKPRDRLAVELLWYCGLRRGELARIDVVDIDFVGGFVVVRVAKNGKPRVVPLPTQTKASIRRHLGSRADGRLLQMSANSIRLMLQRNGLPSSHAWRRGWAVASLRNGVSETSLKAAGGWSSGAMVSRYTQSLSGTVAVEEFQRIWREKPFVVVGNRKIVTAAQPLPNL